MIAVLRHGRQHSFHIAAQPPHCGEGSRRPSNARSLGGPPEPVAACTPARQTRTPDSRPPPTPPTRSWPWARDTAGDRFEAHRAADADASAPPARVGGPVSSIELQTRVHLAAITEDRHGLAAAVAPAFGLTAEQALASPTVSTAGASRQGCQTGVGGGIVTHRPTDLSVLGTSCQTLPPPPVRRLGADLIRSLSALVV